MIWKVDRSLGDLSSIIVSKPRADSRARYRRNRVDPGMRPNYGEAVAPPDSLVGID